ncbi:MAG: FimB/Mfa2 family fimbrial subunit, partial [Bacteroidaceae bacterium]|nr:FimB/Mfa2 family fimbrial subunit [Bacteroidaceae bacterium]
MRKILISLSTMFALLVVFMVFSCEKLEIPNDQETGDVKGNLRVSVFQIENTPFESLTRSTEAASAVVTRLNFAVYDTDDSRLKQVNQTSDMADFGHASFQLPEGTYQLVVVGHSANGNPTMTNPAKIQFTNATGYTDTFLCYGEVTIGEEAVDYQVSLDRIVALCRFVITDDIPADVHKMQFYYTGGSGAFNAATGLGSVASKQTVTVDITDGSQKQFDLYTFLHEQSDNIALKVTALDASGNVLYERTFDVPMEQNHITWLSGAFFNGSGSSSTSITDVTVNTDWA